MRLEIALDLIVPDNTAYTVLVALRDLGYDGLARVERSHIFSLDVQDGTSEREVIDRIARAEVLFNPNKHRLSYALEPLRPTAGNGAPRWEALVTDTEDDTRSLVALLAGPFHVHGLRALARGIAWRLSETDGPAPQSRVEWACRTLLANPVSQRYEVRPLPARKENTQ
ncbi:MAG: hypothetical protein JO219_11245 [Candidatus Eremiobacteraeota bacterium]|nr:hypothetical protein [Candidatus Eremiobacteraeota bacterium]MBV8366125.1 hypothetical protein [Candidatus Eremiobacteraeota bacterium]